ncbi:hypothetical protein D3C80_886250 [compost metagenome]
MKESQYYSLQSTLWMIAGLVSMGLGAPTWLRISFGVILTGYAIAAVRQGWREDRAERTAKSEVRA